MRAWKHWLGKSLHKLRSGEKLIWTDMDANWMVKKKKNSTVRKVTLWLISTLLSFNVAKNIQMDNCMFVQLNEMPFCSRRKFKFHLMHLNFPISPSFWSGSRWRPSFVSSAPTRVPLWPLPHPGGRNRDCCRVPYLQGLCARALRKWDVPCECVPGASTAAQKVCHYKIHLEIRIVFSHSAHDVAQKIPSWFNSARYSKIQLLAPSWKLLSLQIPSQVIPSNRLFHCGI